MMRCPKCQSRNPVRSRFCSHCGDSLEALPLKDEGQIEDIAKPEVRVPSATTSPIVLESIFAGTTELFERVRILVANDRHDEALREIGLALNQATWSEDDQQEIRNKRGQVESRQQERFSEILGALQRDYLERMQPVGTEDELARVEQRLDILRAIDGTRPLADTEEQVARLRRSSDVEWTYTRYHGRLRDALDRASYSPFATDSGNSATLANVKMELDALQREWIPEWEQRLQNPDDRVARILIPRLRELATQAGGEYGVLANRHNILTTLAGTAAFWQVEEEYQRWINPPTDGYDAVKAPSQLPQMIWNVVKGTEEQLEQRYVPEGQMLPLADWYDRFLDDARLFAREKGEQDLKRAQDALARGNPFAARSEALMLLEGDAVNDKRPYFLLPDDIRREAKKLLDSDTLRRQLDRRQQADALLQEADRLRLSDPLAAFEKFQQAAMQPLQIDDQLDSYRGPLFNAIAVSIQRHIDQDRMDQLANSLHAQARLKEIQHWISLLPNPSMAGLMANVDPNNDLAETRAKLKQHSLYCRIWQQLAGLEEQKQQLPLEELDQKLEAIHAQIAAAEFAEGEFPLYEGLATYLGNERDVTSRVEEKLQDPNLFPPDPAQTDVQLLRNELTQARSSRHARFKQLVGALEARYDLYRECTEQLTLDGRQNLLTKVLQNHDAAPSEHEIARRRHKEVERLLDEAKDIKRRLAQAAAHSKSNTLRGFQQAWREINDALQATGEGLLGEVLEVQHQMREALRKSVEQLPLLYQRIQTHNQLNTIQGWINLVQTVGIGESEQTLREHFDPLIWRWLAYHARTTLEERLKALGHLLEIDPDDSRLKEDALNAGIDWMIERLEALRSQAAQSELPFDAPGSPAIRPDQVLLDAPGNLEADLYASVEYQSKAAELLIWIDDLPNARKFIEDLQRRNTAFESKRSRILSIANLQRLLKIAEFKQTAKKLQDRHGSPTTAEVQMLRGEFEQFLRPHELYSPLVEEYRTKTLSIASNLRDSWIRQFKTQLREYSIRSEDQPYWATLITMAHLNWDNNDQDINAVLREGLHRYAAEGDSMLESPPSAAYLIGHPGGRIAYQTLDSSNPSPARLLQGHLEIVQQKQSVLRLINQFVEITTGRNGGSGDQRMQSTDMFSLETRLARIGDELVGLRRIILGANERLQAARQQPTHHGSWTFEALNNLPDSLKNHEAVRLMWNEIDSTKRLRQELEGDLERIQMVGADDGLATVEAAIQAIDHFLQIDPDNSFQVLPCANDRSQPPPGIPLAWQGKHVPIVPLSSLKASLQEINREQEAVENAFSWLTRHSQRLVGPLVAIEALTDIEGLWLSLIYGDPVLALWDWVIRAGRERMLTASLDGLALQLEQARRQGFFETTRPESVPKILEQLLPDAQPRNNTPDEAEDIATHFEQWHQYACNVKLPSLIDVQFMATQMLMLPSAKRNGSAALPAGMSGVNHQRKWLTLSEESERRIEEIIILRDRINIVIDWIRDYKTNYQYWYEELWNLVNYRIPNTVSDDARSFLFRQLKDISPEFPLVRSFTYAESRPPFINRG